MRRLESGMFATVVKALGSVEVMYAIRISATWEFAWFRMNKIKTFRL